MMEKEMGEILAERKLDLLIVDVEPNAGIDKRLHDNAEGFLDAYLAKNPQVPVILYSRVLFNLDLFDEYRVELAAYYRTFLRDLAKKYRKKGYKMFFEDGSKIFKGNFAEYTTDGIHPNDIGMRALTDSYERAIKRARR